MTKERFATAYHAPVMVDEVLGALLPPAGEGDGRTRRILDCTLGGGGHSAALLEAGADVTGVDRDPAAIAAATARLAAFSTAGRFRAICTNYADFAQYRGGTPSSASGGTGAATDGSAEQLFDGILIDLGVSSHQFDDAARGFSFREGAPLDMRMDASGATAADWLNESAEDALAQALRDYGDERRAHRMASEIVRRRATRPFATSDDLVGVIRAVHGPRSGPPDFARIFQAVRIAVNDELGSLARALPALRDRLAPSGVLGVITYHSGEDRLVKHTFREWSRSCTCPPRHPVCTCGGDSALGDVVTRRAVVAAADEIVRNARARSAKLRAFRRRASRSTPTGR